MTLEALQKDYCSFNHWANKEIVSWLRSKPFDLMEQEMPSSFPTIKATLLHIWSAEDIWLERLLGNPADKFLFFQFNGSVEAIFDGLLEKSAEFEAYVSSLSEADFQEICPFKLLNGTADSRSRVQMIHHCMNHSTYHRGQIVTMARNFGLIDPPGTDYIKYVRIK